MTTNKKLEINISTNMSNEEASAVLISAVKFAIEKGNCFNTEQITQLLAAMAKVTTPEAQPTTVETQESEVPDTFNKLVNV